MNRLPCCIPTAIYPGSGTVGHGPLCDKAEIPLTPAEYAEWRGHPIVYKGSHLRVVDAPVRAKVTRKRKPLHREWWNVGFRDPAWEDLP